MFKYSISKSELNFLIWIGWASKKSNRLLIDLICNEKKVLNSVDIFVFLIGSGNCFVLLGLLKSSAISAIHTFSIYRNVYRAMVSFGGVCIGNNRVWRSKYVCIRFLFKGFYGRQGKTCEALETLGRNVNIEMSRN